MDSNIIEIIFKIVLWFQPSSIEGILKFLGLAAIIVLCFHFREKRMYKKYLRETPPEKRTIEY